MTAREALDKSIELWEWLKLTGEQWKHHWPGFDGKKVYDRPFGDCYLCEYAQIDCDNCPYYQHYGIPCAEGVYQDWMEAASAAERKEYASEFLAELRDIRANL